MRPSGARDCIANHNVKAACCTETNKLHEDHNKERRPPVSVITISNFQGKVKGGTDLAVVSTIGLSKGQ